ncbi:CUB and sushi domain-containing protein 3-like [Lytechinus variegatus]|uniref:CUB and sushi domain-containing protein 3-like n=1 Tax=Lytechinus variegatus TaxID=7654 RepID=UPI001BB1844B|nr:CUB and sushi domain-containing protein 3-like [Lytechinus variegatus]
MTLVLRCTTTFHTTNCMFTSYTTKFQAFVVYHKSGATNCSAPSIPAHAHLTDRRLNYNYGDRITVTCNTSSDSFTIQCHNKGLWSGPQISCPAPAYAVGLPAKCSAPLIPRYSWIPSLQLSYNHGERVTVQCDNSSVQPFTLRCNTTGLWIGQMRQCPPPIAEPVRCNTPYIPRYGTIDNLRLDYSVGDSVRITCDSSTDSYNLRCNTDGFWTGSVLPCPAPIEDPEKCSAPYVPRYATIQDFRMSYDFSERITVTCDNSSTQFTLQCHTHGLWSGPVVSCPEPSRPPTRCNAPSIPRYSSVRNFQASYDLGARVNVRCDNSSIRFALRCRTGGLWEGQVQACPTPVEKQCSAPYVPRYATIQGLKTSYDFNERITVTCDNDTRQFTLRCHTHGLWSGPVVSCPEPYRPPIRCNSPYIPRHGSIDNLRLDYSVGASVRITCDNSTDNYSLRCNSDGFWTGSVLSCPEPIEAPTRCNAPSIPRYSSVRNLQASYDLGARVIVRCDNSSVRFGLRCRTSGLWEGQVANCPTPTEKPVRCNSPYIPRYGSIDNLRLDYNVGASVRITCDTSTDSYDLQCNSDGFWTGSVLSCPEPIEAPVKCSAPYVPRYATIQNFQLSYNSSDNITVTCDGSSTQFILQCDTNGLWKGQAVSCPEPPQVPRQCNAPALPRYSSIEGQQLAYNANDEIAVSCDGSSSQFTLRCNNAGIWTGSNIDCPAPDPGATHQTFCSAPVIPRHSTNQNLRLSYKPGDRVNVTCNEDPSSFLLVCQEGIWIGQNIVCEEPDVECDPPIIPAVSSVQNLKPRYKVGDEVNVTCNGDSDWFIWECHRDGKWRGRAIDCPIPRPSLGHVSAVPGNTADRKAENERTGFLTTVLLVTALIVFVLVLMSMAGFSIFVKRRVRSSSNEYLHAKSTDRGPLPDVPSGMSGYAGYITGDKPLYTEPYLQPDRNTKNYEDYDTPR